MTTDERKNLAKTKGLCYGCFFRGHLYKDCKHRNSRLMFGNQPRIEPPSEANVLSHKVDIDSQSVAKPVAVLNSMIVPVEVYHIDNPQKRLLTYALLDNQSNACFVTQELTDEIAAPSQNVTLRLTTMSSNEVIATKLTHGLVVRGCNEQREIAMPGTYTRSSIPVDRTLIPRPETVKTWPHLHEVAKRLIDYDVNMDVGLLIGFNCSVALVPRNVVIGDNDTDPYAVHTSLGWGVTGVVSRNSVHVICNDVHVDYDSHVDDVNVNHNNFDSSIPQAHFSFRTSVKELQPTQVAEMFQLDFQNSPAEPLSVQDQRFLKTMSAIHRRPDGHFEIPLPFKQRDIQLPNNRIIAEKRLNSLRRKLSFDTQFRADYIQFMAELIDHGYAERVPLDELEDKNSGQIWYIPHHGVYNPQKPGKIRIVFDCAAEYQGKSLNQQLLSGPDLLNNLTGVLCRFRKEKIAFSCDVESMFHQVGVSVKDRNYLRFLWWVDGQLDQEPVEYRMTVHLFGATSSPGCANYALKHTADIYRSEFGNDTADFLKNDFYVDDGLKSVSDPGDALMLMENSWKLCEKGGFNLRKFVCNNKDVLKAIPENRCAAVQNTDIFSKKIERTLGVQWCLLSDTFLFRIEMQDKPTTRRGILSAVSSIFDPLGLISPFLLTGKKILQELCRKGSKWDDPVPGEIRCRWKKWRLDLLNLSQLQIPRCYKPDDFGTVKKFELHHFSDASMEGYGQCSYLRLIDDHNRIATSLVAAKSRVTPPKSVTIPRLELTAAVVSVKMSNFLGKELQYEHIKHIYWTDSQVILGYLTNESRRFHIFVANRVQQIRDATSPEQWNYVESKLNPADKASRGMNATELLNCGMWWNGPAFLSSSEPLPLTTTKFPLADQDPEVKKVSACATGIEATDQPAENRPDILARLLRFSSWHNTKRAVAVCIKYMNILHNRIREKNDIKRTVRKYVPVNTQELLRAERLILLAVQKQVYPKEYATLLKLGVYARERPRVKERKMSIKYDSAVYRLDPYISYDGLIRVGGRVKRANIPRELVHPVVLPRDHHITRLVITHFHERTRHSGRGITLNEIRSSGYWITHGRAAVAACIWKCVTCRKLRRPTVSQKMADLPGDRLEPAPPFTNSGVDYFGPFYIREARSERKRWGVVFTCLVTRAIHIEVAHTLNTDSFLNAYRRFIGRRGPIRLLRSDRGTNFVGARNDLHTALGEMENDKIQRELLKDGCDWIRFEMNVPHASHMGGVWERMVRSARTVLSALLDQHGTQLDDELLHTLMVEAEAIVNSRPLTYPDMTTPDSAEPLTPSQLLTLKSKVVQPLPGKFVKQDLYCRKRWRRVQFLANEFWTRWKKEYIPTLQERRKWNKPQVNLEPGDIVLMLDENVPRCEWPKAVVTSTYPSDDTYVRKVTVKTATSSFDRPVHKLVLLYKPPVTG